MHRKSNAIWWALAWLVVLAGATVVGYLSWPEGPTPGSGQPNLILISIDTLRADHLGCYGYGHPTSPSVDGLAARGVRFQTVIAQSPWTLPSHVSMVTGLYPHRNGVATKRHKLDPTVPTLASLLRDKGYVTGAFTNSDWLTSRQGFDSGFRDFEHVSEWDGPELVNRAEIITTKAIEWIRANDHEPFFLLVHYYDVHSDYRPDERYREMFVDPDYAGEIDGSTAQLLQVRKGKRELSPADVQQLVNLYDAEIRQLDEQLRRLTWFLEQRGRNQDTFVIFTSDHGEEFMEHGGVLHGKTMYEEVIAVPLIITGPGIPAGEVVEGVTQITDIVPTALALLEKEASVTFDGIDLRSSWGPTGAPDQSRFAFAEADWQNAEPDILRMVRNERFKLIYNRHDGSRRLYDLVEDPAETKDISTTQIEVTALFMRMLRSLASGGRDAAPVKPPSKETEERLKSLGYL